LSLSIGFQGALSTTLALLAHPLLDCCLLAAANTFLLSQYNLAIATSTLSCWVALRELTKPYQGYIKRRNRGWLPHKRAFARSLASWQQLIWSTTLASLCFAVLLFREQHEVHLASGTLSDISLDDPHELNQPQLVSRARSNSTSPCSMTRRWMPGRLYRVLMLLASIQGAVAVAITADEPKFALQHIMFCFKATHQNTYDHQYDSDSFLIAIDNCSSKCITNSMSDYIQEPQPIRISVKGIGGTVTATYKGRVSWPIEDNQGVRHDLVIDDVYFNASSPYRLLSPQHWAQT
jgi:hypothetical protein